MPIEEVLRVIGSIIGRDIVARLDRDHVRAVPVTGASADERGIEYLADTKNTHDCDMGGPRRAGPASGASVLTSAAFES